MAKSSPQFGGRGVKRTIYLKSKNLKSELKSSQINSCSWSQLFLTSREQELTEIMKNKLIITYWKGEHSSCLGLVLWSTLTSYIVAHGYLPPSLWFLRESHQLILAMKRQRGGYKFRSRSARCFEWILHCARVPIIKYSLGTPDHLHTVFISPSLFRPHTGFTFFATSGSASCSTRPLAFPYPVAQITTSAGSSDPSSNTMLFFEKWEIWESFLSFTFPSTMSWLQPISRVFVSPRTSSG